MSGKAREERRQNAIKNAKMAYKLIETDDVYKELLAAIENKDSEAFKKICTKLGIPDLQMNKLWRLIKYEAGKQQTNICW